MTTTTNTPLPPVTAQTTPVTPSNDPAARPAALQEGTAKLLTLPEGLQTVSRALHVDGQVIRQNPDGSTKIRTDQGDIDVQTPPDAPRLRNGERVAVDIPPGRPPETATITREAPRTSQTPVNVDVPPPAETYEPPVPVTPAAPRELAEDQTARLEPVTPERAAAAIPVPAEIIAAVLQNLETSTLPVLAQAVAALAQTDAPAPLVTTPQTPAPAPSVFVVPAQILPGQAAQALQGLLQAILPTAGFPAPEILMPAPDFKNILTPVMPALGQEQPPAQVLLTPPLVQIPAAQLDAPLTGIPVMQAEASLLLTHTAVTLPALTLQKAKIVTLAAPAALVTAPENLAPKIKTAPENFILQNQQAGTLMATVTGQETGKLPVLSMFVPQTGQENFFVLHLPVENIVPGTQITLIPQEGIHAGIIIPAAPGMAQAPPQPLGFFAPQPWPVMDDIFQLLAQIMPHAAQGLANITPSPGNPAQFGPAALFFIAALRGGDLTQWIGDRAADALRRAGRGGSLTRLGQEGNTLNRLSSEPVSQDWRGLSLPLYWENRMEKITLYYRHDEGREDKDKQGKQMRFVFDLNLNVMGKVQLDGLFRAGRLDLVVRTLTPFSSPMQAEMRHIYAEGLRETGVTGELSFQNRPEQWVTITPGARDLGVSA